VTDVACEILAGTNPVTRKQVFKGNEKKKKKKKEEKRKNRIRKSIADQVKERYENIKPQRVFRFVGVYSAYTTG
jgi:hypothetical protein